MASNAGELSDTPMRRRQVLGLIASGLAVTILPACVAGQPAGSAAPTAAPAGSTTKQTSSAPTVGGAAGSTPVASSGIAAQPKTAERYASGRRPTLPTSALAASRSRSCRGCTTQSWRMTTSWSLSRAWPRAGI
jgi:hypothetical protein